MQIEQYFRELSARAQTDTDAQGSVKVIGLGEDAVDVLVGELTAQYRRPMNRITGDPIYEWVNEEVHSEGVNVTIPLERGGGDAASLMEWEPSKLQQIAMREPAATPSPRGLTFRATGRTQAAQVLDCLRTNIEQRNLEIERGNSSIDERIRAVVARSVDGIRAREATADEEWGDVLGKSPHSSSDDEPARDDDQPSSMPSPTERENSSGGSQQTEELPAALAEAQSMVAQDADAREFLSRTSATVGAGDPKAFQIMVADVERRMRALEDDPGQPPNLRAHAGAAASSLNVILGEVTGEFAASPRRSAEMSFETLVIELAVLGVQLWLPPVGALALAGRLILKYVAAQRTGRG